MCLCLCFPSSAQIWTLRAATVLVADLKPQEPLLTVEICGAGKAVRLRKTRFHTYLHYDSAATPTFLSIQSKEAELVISPDHLLFTGAGVAVPARDVQIGDSLLHVRREDAVIERVEVTQVSWKTEQGLFAPLTQSGTLIVNGFFVSCYAHVLSQALAHATLAPLRLWYSQRRKWRQHLKGHAEGVHPFAKALLALSKLLPNALTQRTMTSNLREAHF